ncbi:MAG TPA: hypothetical protein VNW92_07820 [Polyangiaceae bacterium]|nr:hypothetical protein [Polyangiaceae bacterium]
MADRSRRPSYRPFDELYTGFVDADRHWGPFLFLRPRASVRLSVSRVLMLSALVGVAFGLLGSIVLALAARAAGRPPLAVQVFPLTLTALYFCLCQLTFVPAWNRRAARLAKHHRT